MKFPKKIDKLIAVQRFMVAVLKIENQEAWYLLERYEEKYVKIFEAYRRAPAKGRKKIIVKI